LTDEETILAKEKTTDPVWNDNDIIPLIPLATLREYLQLQWIRMVIKDKSGPIMGTAVITLEEACGQEPFKFSSQVVDKGRVSGRVEGSIHVVWSGENVQNFIGEQTSIINNTPNTGEVITENSKGSSPPNLETIKNQTEDKGKETNVRKGWNFGNVGSRIELGKRKSNFLVRTKSEPVFVETEIIIPVEQNLTIDLPSDDQQRKDFIIIEEPPIKENNIPINDVKQPITVNTEPIKVEEKNSNRGTKKIENNSNTISEIDRKIKELCDLLGE